MCGILGGNNSKWNYKLGIEKLKHRGPDSQKIITFGSFYLGFVRLAIQDISKNAMQPMISDDGNVALVFNGEIYNFIELRCQLEKKGYIFKTLSDTEVILNAYVEYGKSFINKIDGMFAIVLLDKKKKRLYLYRDRFGIKPLYYYYSPGGDFAFASELKGLEAVCANITFDIDTTAVYDFLFYQYIPDPKSLYKQVKKIEPATCIEYDLASRRIVKEAKYWKLVPNTKKSDKGYNFDEVKEKVREILHNAVVHQMVADVPVGTFLSGGVDSSVISYECSTVDSKIEAFCVAYKEKMFDESEYAQSVADAIGINLNKGIMNLYEAVGLYNSLKNWFDEPFGDTTAYANYLVSKQIRKNITVALSGDGGDEVFGGYARYSEFEKLANVKVTDLIQRKICKRCGWDDHLLSHDYVRVGDEVEKYAYVSGFGFEDHIRTNLAAVKKALYIDKEYDVLWHFRQFYHKDLPRITAAQFIDMNSYLSSGMLPKVDRTSMAVSLEVRVPLLDTKLVEYSFSLPQDIRCNGSDLKKILKEAYIEFIPKKCLYRKKHGFSVPSSYYTRMGLGFRERVLKDMWGITL